jgi:hypothetical protein
VTAAKGLAKRAVPAGLIVLAALALATPAQAAFPGNNGKLAWSLYSGTGPYVEVANPDGTGRMSILNGIGPAWSADGGRIAFSTPNGDAIHVTGNSGETVVTQSRARNDGAAWSPDGTKIAFMTNRTSSDEVWVVNVDGTNETQLTNVFPTVDGFPDWSPDGSKIAFASDRDGDYDIYTMNPDGTNQVSITPTTSGESFPNWSPDGTKIAFTAGSGDTPFDDIWVMNADGTERVRLTTDPAYDSSPAWSPDGRRIAFISLRTGRENVFVMNADGSGQTNITNDNEIEMSPDWQPIPYTGYPRPKGATPFLTYLVPAYDGCASPNRQHGYPLAFASCNPPTQSSNSLTVGSADSNGKPTKSVSSVRFDTLVGKPSTFADEADVKITAQVIDVYTQAGLSDYAGELTAIVPLRITDKLNGEGSTGAGTVSDIPYSFTIPCAVTADTTIGGACTLSTTADALTPWAVTEGKRSIWSLGQVVVYDANGDPFMKQGIFVP